MKKRLGYIDTTVFQRNLDGVSVSNVVNAVNALYAAERRTPPQVQSALALVREWEKLKDKQVQWRNILAGVLGLDARRLFMAPSLFWKSGKTSM